jgi:hypothetical protein
MNYYRDLYFVTSKPKGFEQANNLLSSAGGGSSIVVASSCEHKQENWKTHTRNNHKNVLNSSQTN